MPDREKVIKAIDICLGHGKCDDCGYRIKGGYSTMDCRKPMMRDALALLKEQEAVEPSRILDRKTGCRQRLQMAGQQESAQKSKMAPKIQQESEQAGKERVVRSLGRMDAAAVSYRKLCDANVHQPGRMKERRNSGAISRLQKPGTGKAPRKDPAGGSWTQHSRTDSRPGSAKTHQAP